MEEYLKLKLSEILVLNSTWVNNSPTLHEVPILGLALGDALEVNVVPDGLEWCLTTSKSRALSMSSLTNVKERVVGQESVALRHNLVGQALVPDKKTDVKLHSAFGVRMGSPWTEEDNMSPDYCIEYEDNHLGFIELSTTRSSARMMDMYKAKIYRYQSALENRFHIKKSQLHVIVVSPRSVLTSIELPDNTLRDLVVRMQVGMQIEDMAKNMGLHLEDCSQSSDADSPTRSMKNLMSAAGFIDVVDGQKVMTNGFEAISITRDFINKVTGEWNGDTIMNAFKYSKVKAIGKMVKLRDMDHDSLINKYWQSFEPRDNSHDLDRRSDRKTIIQFPSLFPRITTKLSPINRIIGFTTSDDNGRTMVRIWNDLLVNRDLESCEKKEVDSLLSEAYCPNSEVHQREEDRKKKRSLFHRVTFEGIDDPEIRLQLAKDGVLGKSMKSNDSMREKRHKSQRLLSIDTPTDDLDDMMEEGLGSWFDILESETEFDNVKLLLERANDLVCNSNEHLVHVENLMKTKVGHWCTFISQVASELMISLRQNCKKKEFILKKLLMYDVYLLIKPTNSSSHIFVSFFIPNPIHIIRGGNIFKSPIFLRNGGVITHFISFKEHKLVNLVKAPSRLIGLYSFWNNFYSIDSLAVEEFREHGEAKKMLMISLMIYVENKTETEETITLSRYMYMETFKSINSIIQGNPLKVLSKFTSAPRSRLNLWVIRRLVCCFKDMVVIPPRRVNEKADHVELDGEDSEDFFPGDQWEGLLNFFTGGKLNSATSAVNLMYMGYLKDKQEPSEKNSEFKLISKIIEEEMKVEPGNRNGYYGSPTDLKNMADKEFSADCLMYGSDQLIQRLRKQMGEKWRDQVEYDCIRNLSRHLTSTLATLKASSPISHVGFCEESGDLPRLTAKGRIKVIEAVAANLELLTTHPMKAVTTILKHVENNNGGIICDLFQKSQHGGLREIYVLTLESRVLQLYIETFSRTICSYFEEETLTHPDNKLKILEMHKRKVRIVAGKDSMSFADFCTSSDKTRWSQGFLMTAMSIPLFRILPVKYHGIVQRIMNLWTTKMLQMPESVVQMLHRDIVVSSPVYEELLRSKHGRLDRPPLVTGPSCKFMTVTSGFMQGILHYTSSLAHLTFLQASKTIMLSSLRQRFPEEKYKFFMSSVCSSDDASTILSVLTKSPCTNFTREDSDAFRESEILLYTMSEFCNYFCMVDSDKKSTIACWDYVEFNSEFLFKNTLAMPVIKYVIASAQFTESESLPRRFYEMYNMLQAVFESGLPALNTHLCQIAQALMHYKSLGLGMTKLFGHYADEIIKYPDISHGFFLLDTYFCPGLMGLSYSRWMAATREPSLRSTLMRINTTNLESTPDGGIMDSLTMMHGDLVRYHKLIDRVIHQSLNLTDTATADYHRSGCNSSRLYASDRVRKLMNDIEESTSVLYRHPETPEELLLKLLSLATSPGVSKSLCPGDPAYQAFSSSCYVLFTHCFTRSTLCVLEGKRSRTIEKVSLLSSLKERISNITRVDEAEWQQMSVSIFPHILRYKEFEDIRLNLAGCRIMPCRSFRQKKD